MKKSLLLAAMFLSSAVQAESFVCETIGWATANQSGADTGKVDRIWIVDSDKGWKLTGNNDYEGVCDFLKLGERDVLECKNTEGPFLSGDIYRHEFTIWLGRTVPTNSGPQEYSVFGVTNNNEFIQLIRRVGSVDAYSGKCTKI